MMPRSNIRPTSLPARLANLAVATFAILGPLAFARAPVHIPLFVDGSNPMQQSFVRLVNQEAEPTELLVTAIDDAGNRFGPASFTVDGWGARHFNTKHLREALADDIGERDALGELRLVIESASGRAFDARGYMRTQDGFVTAMQDLAQWGYTGDDAYRYIPIFNPASNRNQRSRLRLVHRRERPFPPVEVTITGIDDTGASPGPGVVLTLEPGTSRTLSAADLESGAPGIEGSLGDGEGKWRIEIRGSADALGLLESPTGHLTNLSSGGPGQYSNHIHLFRPASHPTQQSFARIVNRADVDVTIKMTAFDDAGTLLGTAPLDIPANGASHFNSDHLAEWLHEPVQRQKVLLRAVLQSG